MREKQDSSVRARAEAFASRLGIRLPILLAPMAGACPPSLSIEVANAGGLGACGALMMTPDEIRTWSAAFRQGSQGEFQINLWIPEPPPPRDFELEKRQREFLATWGPPVKPDAGGDHESPALPVACNHIGRLDAPGNIRLLNCSEFSSRLSKTSQALNAIPGIQFPVGRSIGLVERWSLGSISISNCSSM